MDTKELVERLATLKDGFDTAIATIERLERERDRYRSGLEVMATSFYKDDQHQNYAKHVLGDAQISAESEAAALRARVARLEAENMRLTFVVMNRPSQRHFDILAEAMAEIKATSDGLSDQTVAEIVAGCIREIADMRDE